MTRAAARLDRFPLVRTRNVEEMRAALERVYARPTWHLEAGTNQVDVTLNYYPTQHAALGYTKYGADLGLVYPESEWMLQTFPICGQGELTVVNAEGVLDARHGIAMSARTGFAVRLSANYEHFVLLLDTKALTAKLEALAGVAVNQPLKVHAIRDDAHPAAKLLRDHFFLLAGNVDQSAVPLPKWVLAEFEQTLMVMSLYANRHNYTHHLERRSPRAGRSQIRRAEECIEANWQRFMALEDLGTVAGVSIACLVQSFRESRGSSPMEFARRVRLRHARRLLQHPEGATTAAVVAAICGFANLGRFAADYLRAFGERPSTTLRRGQGDPTGH